MPHFGTCSHLTATLLEIEPTTFWSQVRRHTVTKQYY